MQKNKFDSDQEIIERIRTNDRTVLGDIFTLHEKMVGSYILKHGGSQSEVDDILQDCIIILWQRVNSGTFRLTSKLSTFLMGIAKNRWRAERRKRHKISGLPDQFELQDGNPSSLDKILTEEKMIVIRNALNEISSICKKMLTLFYFEERSMDDIAKIMNFANPDVAKSKKYQCKKQLEIIVKKYLEKS